MPVDYIPALVNRQWPAGCILLASHYKTAIMSISRVRVTNNPTRLLREDHQMSILLPAPWITQSGKNYEDPTGCWYASACMIAYFFEAGPRLGLPTLFTKPLSDGRLGHFATGSAEARAANPTHHSDLAKNEGFEAVRNCSTDYVYSLNEVETLLQDHGPMFMYWFKRNGRPIHRTARTNHDGSYGHASVIVGTTTNGLIFHDPEYERESDGANRNLTLNDFNKSRQYWKWALMQRAGVSRFQVARRVFSSG